MEVKGGIVRSNLKRLLVERETIERRRITQEEIAGATGLRQATISKWLSPKTVFKMIDSEALTKLSNYMGVEFQELLIVEYPDKAR